MLPDMLIIIPQHDHLAVHLGNVLGVLLRTQLAGPEAKGHIVTELAVTRNDQQVPSGKPPALGPEDRVG
ncbi:MAG: hypothetical protein BWY71_01330 [Planctomycetes bacterium ADurb.Bin412]|nr:MAG: hypothetical protein BWY71_01330 [Planctomycetes bacterium ADurb.Bin412]